MQQVKRYASHYLFLPEVGFLKQQVVELEGGFVSRIFPLTEEIESVEWMPGVIVLVQSDCNAAQEPVASTKLVPYLLYPFDFTSMQPVAETRRRLLR